LIFNKLNNIYPPTKYNDDCAKIIVLLPLTYLLKTLYESVKIRAERGLERHGQESFTQRGPISHKMARQKNTKPDTKTKSPF